MLSTMLLLKMPALKPDGYHRRRSVIARQRRSILREFRRRDLKRRKWWKQYFKRAARRKYQKLRRLTAALVAASALYLLAAAGFNGKVVHAEEALQIEMVRAEAGDAAAEQIWRITLDLKSGELIFYREERRKEAGIVYPVKD